MKDPNQKMYDAFARLSKTEQREVLLSIAERCIDACPPSFARRVEIYLKD